MTVNATASHDPPYDEALARRLAALGDEDLDAVAIAYCSAVGHDPDRLIHAPSDGGLMLLRLEPLWRAVARTLRGHVARLALTQRLKASIDLVTGQAIVADESKEHL